MTEHTALPLKLIAYSDGTYIIDADGEIFNDDAFTVTACNCHADLLEACKTAFDYLADSYEESEAFQISQVLEQAICKAEESAK